MPRDETIMGVMIILSTIGAIVYADLYVFHFFSGGRRQVSQPSQVASPVQYQQPVMPPSNTCGSTTSACTAVFSTTLKSCNRENAEDAARATFNDMMKNEDCRAADRDLATGCPSGCSIDFRTRLVLPSATKYSFKPPRADGSCEVEASKTISFRAGCFN